MILLRKLQVIIYKSISVIYTKFIWPMLPNLNKPGEFNGVRIGWLNQRFGSQFFPFEIACKPNFKRTNIELLRNNVESGDIVTIIGGGRGITSVVAARMA